MANENFEQAMHVLMGFGARLTYLDFLLFRRETVKQWPPATEKMPVIYVNFETTTISKYSIDGGIEYYAAPRVKDTLNDMESYMIGYYLAEIVRWTSIGVWLFESKLLLH